MTKPAPTMPGPLGIYVHWPFCLALCPYCDFNSHVADRLDDDAQARWQDAYLAELAHYAARAGKRRVESIFFGGGTPSLMAPNTAAAVIDAIAGHFDVADDVEITLEANPTSAEAERFAGFASAGVNRISLGVQALDDDALAFLGRRHNASEARTAIELAAHHFGRYSFDLIYARPEQDVTAWQRELTDALTLAASHLSVYQLTIEPGTPFFLRHAEGSLDTPGDAVATRLFEATQEVLEAAGMPAYEISNHATAGHECRHNLIYWRYDDYLGIGPGAHGRLTINGAIHATRQHRAPEIWLQRVTEIGHATRTDEPLDAPTRAAEALMMGLRLAEGIDARRFEIRTGETLDDALDADAIARLIQGGFIDRDATGLRATPAGRQRLDAVLGALLA